VDSNAIFIDGLFIPEADRIGEEGNRLFVHLTASIRNGF